MLRTRPRPRPRWLPALLAVPILCAAGCASTHPAAHQAVTTPITTGSAMAVSHPPDPSAEPDPARSPGPSAAALMVCAPEIRHAVATMLALPAPPPVSTNWAQQIFTCTYRLSAGRLVLSVHDAPDPASGQRYFDTLRRRLAPTQPLAGLAGLGQPGYTTGQGIVVVVKDGKTLQVDTTGLPAHNGPHQQSRDDLAYEITTDVLGCWTGK